MNLNKHAVLFWIVVFFLILGTFITVFIGSKRFKDWDLTHWFKDISEYNTSVSEENTGVVNWTNRTYLKSDVNYQVMDNIAFLSSSANSTAKNGVMMSANYIGLFDKAPSAVNWELKWQNESDWSKNKQVKDYISLNKLSDTTVAIQCLQAFGEPIILKAVNSENDCEFKTCKIDFVKNVTKFSFQFGNGENAIKPKIIMLNGYEFSQYSVTISNKDQIFGGGYEPYISYGLGTVKDESQKIKFKSVFANDSKTSKLLLSNFYVSMCVHNKEFKNNQRLEKFVKNKDFSNGFVVSYDNLIKNGLNKNDIKLYQELLDKSYSIYGGFNEFLNQSLGDYIGVIECEDIFGKTALIGFGISVNYNFDF